MFYSENGKRLQWLIKICASIHENPVNKGEKKPYKFQQAWKLTSNMINFAEHHSLNSVRKAFLLFLQE